jgi:hypothetical protein
MTAKSSDSWIDAECGSCDSFALPVEYQIHQAPPIRNNNYSTSNKAGEIQLCRSKGTSYPSILVRRRQGTRNPKDATQTKPMYPIYPENGPAQIPNERHTMPPLSQTPVMQSTLTLTHVRYVMLVVVSAVRRTTARIRVVGLPAAIVDHGRLAAVAFAARRVVGLCVQT